jgi:hypothetical protein
MMQRRHQPDRRIIATRSSQIRRSNIRLEHTMACYRRRTNAAFVTLLMVLVIVVMEERIENPVASLRLIAGAITCEPFSH